MQVWKINLLGIPCASCGDRTAHLRSKETWAVLASLLLPVSLNNIPFSERLSLHSREALAMRFWGECVISPRTCLRQSLVSLREAFGSDCLVASRSDVRVMPERFATDIEQMLALYAKAMASSSLEERTQCLIEAESEIRGEFLEGSIEAGDSGESWLTSRRIDISSKIAMILNALVDALLEGNNGNGALDIARKAVRFQPENSQAQKRVRDLARQTGQKNIMRFLDGTSSFESATIRLRNLTQNALTTENSRHFQSLFAQQFNNLPRKRHQSFLRLSIFRAPFHHELATSVCRVPLSVLDYFVKLQLVEYSNGSYSLLSVVQEIAWRKLPTSTKQQLQKRLALRCRMWVAHEVDPSFPPFSLFMSHTQIEPFLQSVLNWEIQQSPTMEQVRFMIFLDDLQLSKSARSMTREIVTSYFRKLCVDETVDAELRYHAGHHSARLLSENNDFVGAIASLEQVIASPALVQNNLTNLCFLLGLAYHYSGNSHTGIFWIQKTKEEFQHRDNAIGISQCSRVQCEILNHLGEYEQALQAGAEALDLRRAKDAPSSAVADALFWKGSTLYKLSRFTDAVQCVEEALFLWQEAEETTGVAFCLRLLGAIYSEQGRYAEARSHLEHAISLHERTGDIPSRLAAVEILGDVFVRQNRLDRAEPLYQECLADSEARNRPNQAEGYRRKIAACQGHTAPSSLSGLPNR